MPYVNKDNPSIQEEDKKLTRIQARLHALIRQYHQIKFYQTATHAGVDMIETSGKFVGAEELINGTDAVLDGWWTDGRFADTFSKLLRNYLDIKLCLLTNSGSSANLIAFFALTSPLLGSRQVRAGDEVITVAAAFPTTVNPIVQAGCVPVFVDIELSTLNINWKQLEKALSKKTKAIMVAHTQGNPFNLDNVVAFARAHNLWLVEDSCDALGAEYRGKKVGTFGDIATFSFYPAHQMSCSHNSPIPYLDESGRWRLEKIEKIYDTYVNQPGKIKILAFDKNYKVDWVPPSSITRHKLGHSKKMLRIKTQHGREVEVTEDHSVFIIDQDNAQIVPIAVKDLTNNDYIVVTNYIPHNKVISSIDILDYFNDKEAYVSNFSKENLPYVKNSDYRWQYKSRNSLPIRYLNHFDLNKQQLTVGISQSAKIPARISINKELCRLIGYFLAEGSYQNGLVFTFNKNEIDLISDVQEIVKSQFNIVPTVRKSRNNVTNVEVQSKNLEIVFKEVFKIKKGAKNKRIPWFMFHTNEECIKSFVYGYTRGDGSIKILEDNTNRIDVTSVSKDLLNDFQYLLSKIGISASFYRRNKRSKEKQIKKIITSNSENFTLCFSGYQYKNRTLIKQNSKDRNNFADQIPLLPIFRKYISVSKDQQVISKKRLQKYLKSNSRLYALTTGDLSFLKARSIEKISYNKNAYVYDFSVPGKENFYGGFLGLFLHNTMGEGGAVVTNNSLLFRIAKSFRDWGRDCWCETGEDNACRRRFSFQFKHLPFGYDHKFVYSHLGFNVKLTDMQAAIGVAQISRIDTFVKARRDNFQYLLKLLSSYRAYFLFQEAEKESNPSWFGFMLTLTKKCPFTLTQLCVFLNDRKIATRPLYCGNITRQPFFEHIQYRSIGTLPNTDYVMEHTFWVGVHPNLTSEHMDYMVEVIKKFVDEKIHE